VSPEAANAAVVMAVRSVDAPMAEALLDSCTDTALDAARASTPEDALPTLMIGMAALGVLPSIGTADSTGIISSGVAATLPR